VEGYDCKTNALQAYVEHQCLLIREKAETEHRLASAADVLLGTDEEATFLASEDQVREAVHS
jgi:hypothetical protein